MKRHALLALMMPLIAAAAPPPQDRTAVGRALAAIYRPYTIEAAQPAVWERPLFTAEIRRLIARWKQVMPADDVDNLNGGDWLCLCQDWDPKKFSAAPQGYTLLPGGVIEVSVGIDLGNGQRRSARLMFRREGADWRIANMLAADFPHGLIQALRETIAEDEKLPK